MIVAVGYSPAWQQIVVLDALRTGEVNRAREVSWCAGGKTLNAAAAIVSLDAPRVSRRLTVVTPFGGRTGEAMLEDLTGLGVRVEAVRTEAPTRVCTTLIEGGVATEIVENQARLRAEELAELATRWSSAARSADFALLTGSLPAGAPPDTFSELLATCGGRGILDTRGAPLEAALARRPIVVKPNRNELAETVGRRLESERATLEAMHEVRERGAEWVVVTSGASPVLVASAAGEWRIRPPRVTPVNAIGCGDTMAGAIAWALDTGKEPLEAVRWGVAASAENLGTLLMGRVDSRRVASRVRELVAEPITRGV